MADHAAHAAVSAATEAPGSPAHEAEANFHGIGAPVFVALSMLVVIAIMLWKRVPAVIGAALDRKIAGIRANLDEAAKLRAEAETLKADYERKATAAAQEADAIVAHAREEAQGIVAQAEADAASLIERRGRMAEDKIAAAERSAIAEVRATAADAAARAAAALIAERHDAGADRALVDEAIAGISAARLN